ncbi:MAG: hypothetical protein HRT45_17915 [Bdellovibrionales bacterium]|nr:hypothetical protein [Bdellovibrionales bacterium]
MIRQNQIYAFFSLMLMVLTAPSANAVFSHVQRNCIGPAERAIQQCQQEFQLQGMAAVQWAGEATTGDGQSSVDNAEAVAGNQGMGAGIQNEIGSICGEAATLCEERCRESMDHHNTQMQNAINRQDVAGAQRHRDHAQTAATQGRQMCAALGATSQQAFMDAAGLAGASGQSMNTAGALSGQGQGGGGGGGMDMDY